MIFFSSSSLDKLMFFVSISALVSSLLSYSIESLREVVIPFSTALLYLFLRYLSFLLNLLQIELRVSLSELGCSLKFKYSLASLRICLIIALILCSVNFLFLNASSESSWVSDPPPSDFLVVPLETFRQSSCSSSLENF